MPWLTVRDCLKKVGPDKLSKLTLEPNVAEPTTPETGGLLFTTAFFGSSALTVYVAGSPTVIGEHEAGPDGRDQILFEEAPSGTVTASSKDGINVDVLFDALIRAQAKVRGYIDSAMYAVPADDAANAPVILCSWAWDVAAWLLASDLRRPGLLEVYPEIEARFDALFGKEGELPRVAAGKFSLRGALSLRTMETQESAVASFDSNPRIFGGTQRGGIL